MRIRSAPTRLCSNTAFHACVQSCANAVSNGCEHVSKVGSFLDTVVCPVWQTQVVRRIK